MGLPSWRRVVPLPVLALWPMPVRPADADDAAAMVARLRRAVIAVEVKDVDGRRGRGTGFLERLDPEIARGLRALLRQASGAPGPK
jgi:hypothetical protein